jgi:hypothetical protein
MPKNRRKPDRTQPGRVHEFALGTKVVHIVVNCDADGNIRELFGKNLDGFQAELDGMCMLASLALQYGCPIEMVIDKLRGRKHEPRGIAGQAVSISDGIARILIGYISERDRKRKMPETTPKTHENGQVDAGAQDA